jgi:hypothetical protein
VTGGQIDVVDLAQPAEFPDERRVLGDPLAQHRARQFAGDHHGRDVIAALVVGELLPITGQLST